MNQPKILLFQINLIMRKSKHTTSIIYNIENGNPHLYIYISNLFYRKIYSIYGNEKTLNITFWNLLEAVYISVLIAIGNKTLPKSKVAC